MMIEKVKEMGNSKGVSSGSRNEETTKTASNFGSECRMQNGINSCKDLSNSLVLVMSYC